MGSHTVESRAGAITYRLTLDDVDWTRLKATLAADAFDNGRSAEQLSQSFANSYVSVLAYDGNRIVGTARALSDGVCNALVVDVWTQRGYRGRGIATTMLGMLESELPGQHISLFTDRQAFYRKRGYRDAPNGMSKVSGRWLQGDA